jgi:hypothetical protein
VWLVDPLDWPEAIDRALTLGDPAGVIQLLDRHNRDCARLAAQFGIPHLVVPDAVAGSPFEVVPVMRRKHWRETALWWLAARTLVIADALGSNRFYTGGQAPIGVHVLLRFKPPKALAALEPERVLVGHGEGVVGPDTARILGDAVRTSLRRLPGVLLRMPFATRAPSRPR